MCDTHKIEARKFVTRLLTEGSQNRCDDTSENFNYYEKLPPFYDEEKFKKGQKFFHENIFAMFFAKMLGLLSVLSIPTVLKLLSFTNMSSTEVTAFKRYMQTIFHMYIWYTEDFKPGSRIWKSIEQVRHRHNQASKSGCAAKVSIITQKDMAVTQFGFIGYTLVRSEQVGIHSTDRQKWEAFVHLWRVIGHILGIEDRFNICRESLEETREICRLILELQIKPNMDSKDENFFSMCKALINGMWCMNPILQYNVFMGYLYHLGLEPTEQNKMDRVRRYISLNTFQELHFKFLEVSAYLMKYYIVKTYLNWTMYFTLWIMPRFPFLTFFTIGYKNSSFAVLNDTRKSNGHSG